ncbi:MAG: hypothetical protein ACYDAC_11450 [Candidatus Dormibacteria bacterium]
MDQPPEWLRRPAARLAAAGRALADLPRGFRLVLLAAVVAAGFLGIIVPLFQNVGVPQAEVSGLVPSTVPVGSTISADLAIDNVGDPVITPICLSLSGSGVTLVSADFQGLETLQASANRVCGGSLTGQETISVTVRLRFAARGATTVSLYPAQGNATIGPAFTTRVQVS